MPTALPSGAPQAGAPEHPLPRRARSPLARLSLSARLFLAVLATAAAVALAMGAAASWSFKRGFVGYLNEQAMLRAESAIPAVAAAYARHGDWEFLRNQPERWFELLISARQPDGTYSRQAGQALPPVSDLTGAFLRLTLLDAEQRFILGYPLPAAAQRDPRVERAIRVDGRTVGWIALTPFQSVAEVGARRFQDGQLNASWAVGLAAIALAAAIAWWVSRSLLRPIRRVAQATHELAGGDYSRRVPVPSDAEVGQLARDFNHLARTLEHNERMRRDFMADVSHELRTPLGVLHGELEALEDGIRPIGPQTLKSLQAEVAVLNKLVDDLHDLSLADVAALAYRKFNVDLADIVRQAASLYEQRLKQAGLQLALQLPGQPVMVFGDARRLQQLLLNLLENSCRYTDAGGTVTLRLALAASHLQGRREARLELLDSAPGVPTEVLPRLFERFFRVESSRNRVSGGSGLGLAICQRIVQAHDGRIAAQPSPDGGLWISITLPLA